MAYASLRIEPTEMWIDLFRSTGRGNYTEGSDSRINADMARGARYTGSHALACCEHWLAVNAGFTVSRPRDNALKT